MTTVLVGTEKGAYVVTGDATSAPGSWDVRGPLHAGWKVTAFGTAPDGRTLLAVASNWFGTSVHASRDLEAWEQVATPSWDHVQDADRVLEQVWTFTTVGGAVLAGVAHAGLFRSSDLWSWEPVDALNEHGGRVGWQPGLGGLCAHHVLGDGQRLYVGISSVGVFRSDDGGATFTRRDTGVVPALSTEEGAEADGWCVHGLVADPDDLDRVWRQDHKGVYRSRDGGDRWERIDATLPNEAGFGFPIVRDHASGRLFVVPLESDGNRVPVDGRFAVWASDDDGDSWHVAGTGWPDAPTFTGVLRGAMATDQRGTVAVGSTGGQLWLTTDTGETWAQHPATFPRIGAVTVLAR